MRNYKVFEIIKTFTSHERRKFNDFLNSPYFNKSKKVISFFKYIIKKGDGIITKKQGRKNIRVIATELKMNIGTLRNLMSDLYALSKKYLAFSSLTADKFEVELSYRKEVVKRNCKDLSVIENDPLRRSAERKKSTIVVSYLDVYKASTVNHHIYKTLNNQKKQKKMYKELKLFSEKQLFLTCFSFTELVKDFIESINYHNLYNFKNFGSPHFDIITFCDLTKIISQMRSISGTNDKTFLLEIYYNIFLLYSDISGNTNTYSDLKNEVFKNSKKLSPLEKNIIYNALSGFCAQKLRFNEMDKFFEKELRDLYEIIYTHKYYGNIVSDFMPIDLFRDIMLFASKSLNEKWINNFIEQSIPNLCPDNRKNCSNYAYALLHYKKKKYDESMEYLNKVDINFFFFKIDIKSLLLKIYIDRKETNAITSFIDSFRHFLKNNDFLSEAYKLRYSKFLSFAGRISRYLDFPEKIDLNNLKEQLRKTDNIAYKKWLIFKTESIT